MDSKESTDITLKEALLAAFQENGKSIEDVDFILVGGLGLDLGGFWESADKCDWDIEKLNDEFRIVFKDRTWINKHYSCNGSVRLKYHKFFEKPACVLLHPRPQEFYNIDQFFLTVILYL